ncbi:MAG: hypothetical protein P8Z00_17015 [Anaerolineales bacterium]|jgi:hypothetical protein
MPRIFLLPMILILALGIAREPAQAQQGAPGSQTQQSPQPSPTGAPGVKLHSPQGGQALQGSIPIKGNTDVAGFLSASLYFDYQGDTTHTWFLIAQSDQPVKEGTLAQWDTTTITDGDYNLRLSVTLSDGSQQVATVEGLRVRNYSAVETSTPTPVAPTATVVPGNTAIPTITTTPSLTPAPPTGTPLPPNPAQINTMDITNSMGKGALAIISLFALMGVYQGIRSLGKRHRES